MNAPHIPSQALQGRAIDHLGIAVADVEEASLPYRLLGLPVEGEDELIASQKVRVRVFRAGEVLLELLEPTHPESPIARSITKRGPGLHHVAFRSADLEGDVAALLEEGAAFIDPKPQPGRAGSRVVFLHPKWSNGVLIELVSH